MKKIKFACTHCGHRFEAEEQETLECPRCFWSSSVKKESDLESAPAAGPQNPISEKRQAPALPSGLIKSVASVLGILLVLGLLFYLFTRSRVLEKGMSLSPKEEITEKPAPVQPEATGLASLTEEQKNIVGRKLQFAPDREPSEEEWEILKKQVEFKTGLREQLPSEPWTIEKFNALIAEQEKFYQVPLPRSYRKKLEDHFTAHYLEGKKAFEAGDWLKARDLWVSALAFPIYGDDVKKHRGVVLTMLRNFINDTLSKIGVINNLVIEKKLREKEMLISQKYAELLKALEGRQWPQSLDLLQGIQNLIRELENPQQFVGGGPPYTPAIAQVDEGIRVTLFDLLQVPPPPVAAFDAISADLEQKKGVAETFIPQRLEEIMRKYNESLVFIEKGNWAEAEKLLREIRFPPALAKDAREKSEILKELEQKPQLGA